MDLRHDVEGEGTPVLLLHAGICDGRMWDSQWESFPARHRTARCDLRGFGRTPLVPERFSHGADVIDLIERLGAGPVALVGASFGGIVAQDVTVARPDLVSRLVLACSALADHEWSDPVQRGFEAEESALESGDIEAAVEVILSMWVDGPNRDPGAVDPALRRRVGAMQRRAFELQLPHGEDAEDFLLNADSGSRLGEIGVPTLVLAGAEDVTDIGDIAERLVAEIRGARRETIAAAAHLPSMEKPEEFDRLVLGFLAGG